MLNYEPLDDFSLVGADFKKFESQAPARKRWKIFQRQPVFAIFILCLIVAGCVLAPWISTHDPAEFYLISTNQQPGREFWFGTDYLGRDIFAIIWYGGRVSIAVGLMSAVVITFLGITYGCISGLAKPQIDSAMMRLAEVLQSIPAFLSVLLMVSFLEQKNIWTISLVIGVTGWFGLSRIVRSEVRQIRSSEYILLSRCMGGGVWHIMCKHLIPNIMSAILFMVISSISSSMAMEATLSFLGLGLPVETISWGSMLALADRALLLDTWWVVVIPGVFLVTTLLCVTSVGHHLKKEINQGPGNL